MKSIRFGVACGVLTMGATTTLMAHAQAATDEQIEISRGVSLREKGDDRAALAVFRKVFEQWKTARARAQMGLAEQALGKWAEAEADLQGALAATDDAWITANRIALEESLNGVQLRLGSLDIISETARSQLWVDGQLAGALPLQRPLRLVAGTVAVRITAPGHAAVQRSVVVTPGGLSREIFHLMPLEPSPLRPPASTADNTTAALAVAWAPPPVVAKPVPRAIFYGAVAATVILGCLTTWSGLDVLAANKKYEDAPTRTGFDDGRGRERRTNWLIGSTIAAGVGTALLGALVTDFSAK